MLTYNRGDTFTACTITCASRDPDFIGFKFEDGKMYDISTSPIKYEFDECDSYTILSDHIKTGKGKVLHATHVLMRKRIDK